MAEKLVRLFGDWDKQGQDLIDQMCLNSNLVNDNKIENIEFVADNSYTHAVVFNFPGHEILVPPENVIGLLLEPPEIIKVMYGHNRGPESYPKVGRYFSFAKHPGFEWAPFIGFATSPKADYNADVKRSRRMCMIISNKIMTPYHKIRHQVFKALLKTNLDIDFYGRGLRGQDSRIRGEIPPMNKQSILDKYDIVIDFENNAFAGVTDKYFDTIMCRAIPLTNCREIHEYSVFNGSPPSEYVSFEESIDSIVDNILYVYNNLDRSTKIDSIELARNEILSGSMSLPKWILEKVNG